MHDCPAPDRLHALLADTLPADERESVESHLAGCPDCQRTLDELTDRGLDEWRRLIARPQDSFPIFATSLSDPDTLSFDRITPDPVTPEGYEVLDELGRGGMGIVYKARQRSLNRLVALKVMTQGSGSSPADRERFRREAEAAALLRHPNVVQVYEVGEASGQLYLALEYIAGGTLDDRLAGTPQSAREAASLVEVLARTMHYAHTQGIIHRDLKPANILLTEEGVPKVADFGLARLVESSDGPTRTSEVLGTPSYMAPEQAAARHNEVGPATDVWALGAILYECLTGSPPFKAAMPLLTLHQVVHHDPPSPGWLVPGVPRDLETICLKCLQKEPAARYRSAADLADDLRRFLEGRPVLARPVGPVMRAWKWARANPLPAILGVLVLLSVLAGTVVAAFLAGWALDREATARDRGEKLGKVNDELTGVNALLGQRVEELRRALYSSNLARTERELDDNNQVEARTLLTGCPEDLRGWEWRHLWRRLEGSRVTLEGSLLPNGNGTPVLTVAVSPDGRRLAAGDSQGRVRIWEGTTYRELFNRKMSDRTIRRLTFAPDGTHLALGGDDGKVDVLEIASGKLAFTCPTRFRELTAVVYAPDGGRLVGGGDGGIQVWDAKTGKEMPSLLRDGRVNDLAYSPDGRLLLAAVAKGPLRLWEDGKESQLDVPAGDVYWSGVAFSRDGQHMAAAAVRSPGPNLVWVAEVTTKRMICAFDDPHMLSARPAFTADGKRIVTTGNEGIIRIWDAGTGQLTGMLPGHIKRVASLVVTPEGEFVSSSYDGTVKVWTETPWYQVRIPHGVFVAFSPDGKTIATGGRGPGVRLWDAVTGKELMRFEFPRRSVSALAVGPGMVAAAASDGDSDVRIWDSAMGKELAHWEVPRSQVSALAFDPQGGRLFVGERDAIRVRSLAAGQEDSLKKVPGVIQIWSLALAPDGRLAIGTANRGLWLRSPGGEFEREGKDGEARAVACSRDGHWLAATGDSRIQVEDTRTGEVRFTLAVQGRPNSVSFSPDGKRLAADDKSGVKLWELETGLRVLTLRDPSANEAGFQVAFSPDGQRLAVCNRNTEVTLWDAGPGK
jgi:WD40 repeat protein/predicted Ser/Thr protein kinase